MGKLSKDRRDIYYRKAKEEGYRARSAYKLIQLDEQFILFSSIYNVNKKFKVVDLCAAPGSWSQVIRNRLYDIYNTKLKEYTDAEPPLIVAVDLQDMAPIDNVIQIKGKETIKIILSHFNGSKANIVLCDGAPDVTGMHDIDEYIQSQLLLAALRTSIMLLESGGVFVAKIFRGEYVGFLYSQLKIFFSEVYCCKPSSSRLSSFEAFVVCFNFQFPLDNQSNDYLSFPEFQNFILEKLSNSASNSEHNNLDTLSASMPQYYPNSSSIAQFNAQTIPFVACGDFQGFDSDTTYPLNDNYIFHGPVQPPINPPYKNAVEIRKTHQYCKDNV